MKTKLKNKKNSFYPKGYQSNLVRKAMWLYKNNLITATKFQMIKDLYYNN